MLGNERLRLGELRKKHYEIAGVPLQQLGQDDNAMSPTFPSSPKPTLMKKPALAQKPNIPTKNMVRPFYRQLNFHFIKWSVYNIDFH